MLTTTYPQRLGAGLMGALALNFLHEAARASIGGAPRVDRVGKGVTQAAFQLANVRPPQGTALYATSLAGDIISNSLFYAGLMGARMSHPWLRGVVGGAGAGFGAACAPKAAGSVKGRLALVGFYAVGGFATALALHALGRRR